MEKRTEKKWKTLRTLAAEDVQLENEDVPIALSVPVAEDPVISEAELEEPVHDDRVHDEPVVEALAGDEPVELPQEDTTRIRVSLVPPKKIAEPSTSISEDRDWIAPEPEILDEEGSEEDMPEEIISGDDESVVAVFEELERPEHFFATAISLGPEPTLESNGEVANQSNKVLVAHGVTSTSRLIRETLENFTEAEVETTSDPIRAFELALQKPFRRFFFAMQVGELSGAMLYELISKAYANGSATRTLAPGVVFIREKSDPQLPAELARDARIKGSISKPIRIERLLKSVEDIFEVRDPTVK
ncbi:hypothetical protein N9B73_04345 [Verrucomicrobiales bacterium]|nr:hypothetical protein [Verrucomicrobiales bacterium]